MKSSGTHIHIYIQTFISFTFELPSSTCWKIYSSTRHHVWGWNDGTIFHVPFFPWRPMNLNVLKVFKCWKSRVKHLLRGLFKFHSYFWCSCLFIDNRMRLEYVGHLCEPVKQCFLWVSNNNNKNPFNFFFFHHSSENYYAWELLLFLCKVARLKKYEREHFSWRLWMWKIISHFLSQRKKKRIEHKMNGGFALASCLSICILSSFK